MWKSIAFMGKTLPYLRPYKAMAAGVMAMTVVGSLFALAAPWPMAFLVDSVLGQKEYPALLRGFADGGVWSRIGVAVSLGLALTLITGLSGVLDDYLQTKLSLRMVLDLRSKLFAQLQRLSLQFHEGARSGQYIFQSTAEADNVSMAVETVPPLASSLFTLVGMFVIVYRLNPDLALLASAVVPLIYQSTKIYSDRVQPALYRARELEGGVLNTIFESMTMIRVVQAFGRERYHFDEFRDRSKGALDLRVRVTLMQTAFGVGVTLLTAIGSAMVLAFGAYSVIQKRLTVGELLVVVSYIAAVYQPLEQISTTVANLPQKVIPLRIAFKILATDPDIIDRPGAVDLGSAVGSVAFEHCDFSYPGRQVTLHDIHFEVAPGDVIAIVGPTGAGKSTLMSLLPRFVDVTSGRVLVDGRDVRDVALASLRHNISMVLQEPLLFSGTIRENILYGRLEATDDEVIAAAKAANAHEFIMRLPEQYETTLGERGSRISGGERQRIAVARAFLRDAPILILDEPTSSIDSKTESVILDALDELMKGRTTFMIAHRLATIRRATTIVVLHEGRVVQQGDHGALVSQPGLYREMVEAQGGHVPQLSEVSNEAVPAEAFDDVEHADALADGDADMVALSSIGHGVPNASGPSNGHVTSASTAERQTNAPGRKIVLLGMMTKIPVAGVVWQTMHYMQGFELLGFEVYYVEAHARTPSMFMKSEVDDGATEAAGFIDATMRRFGFANRWAYHALHDGDRHFGLSKQELASLYMSAELIINLHGGTVPTEEHSSTGRLVYLETDPVNVQVEVDAGDQTAIDYLDAHQFHFTFAENLTQPDCLLPAMRRWDFKPTRQPVVFSWWDGHEMADASCYTTIGNWRQAWREVALRGEVYHWSKHLEFLKVVELPQQTGSAFELALSSYDDADRALLEGHRWRVRPALDFSMDVDRYRDYIQASRGEFTVAKDQNVRLRTGWFSDRSATYLAAGRPVITQDTGFGSVLPVGTGLLAFTNIDEAAAAVREVESDYGRHCAAAREIGRQHFGAMSVLARLLGDIGVEHGPRPHRGAAPTLPLPAIEVVEEHARELPEDLVLLPLSRRPLVLPAMTVSRVLSRPIPSGPSTSPRVSIVVVTHDNLVFTRLCLESVLAARGDPGFEVVVVDNASADLTPAYLSSLARRDLRVRYLANDENVGFAKAVNQGLRNARGDVLVVLNNDVVVAPGWIDRLVGVVDAHEIGLAGPVTNAAPNEARVAGEYATYGELRRLAERRWKEHGNQVFDIPMLTMFCVAMRRDVFMAVGPLDERFGLGMFEDDDYSQRVRAAGYRVVCAEGVFVHHFGEASFGKLVPTGEHGELFRRNRALFEAKWGRPWSPHRGRELPGYVKTVGRIHSLVQEVVPEGSLILVVSKGDDALVDHPGRRAWHFPRGGDGGYAGHYPADGSTVLDELLHCRQEGASHLVFPQSCRWWLDHYAGLSDYLDIHTELVVRDEACDVYRWRDAGERSGPVGDRSTRQRVDQ